MLTPYIQVGSDVEIAITHETSYSSGLTKNSYAFSIGLRSIYINGDNPLSALEPTSIIIQRIATNFLLIEIDDTQPYLVDILTSSRSFCVPAFTEERDALENIAVSVDNLRAACFDNGYTTFYHDYSARPEAVVFQPDGQYFIYDGSMITTIFPQFYPQCFEFELGGNYNQVSTVSQTWSVNGTVYNSNLLQMSA